MAGGLKIAALIPPHRGVDADSGPAAVRRDRAPVLRNFLPNRSGRIVMRGPTGTGVSSGAGAREHVAGMITLPNQSTIVSTRAQSATATLEPWDARINQVNAVAFLAQASANAPANYDISGLVRTATAPYLSVLEAPGPYYDFYDQYVYAIGYGSIDNIASAGTAADGIKITSNGYQRRTHLLKRSMNVAGANQFVQALGTGGVITAAAPYPTGACGIRFWVGRCFLGGGALWNGATESNLFPNHLWYSNPIASFATPGTFNAYTQWIDPVTGANNTILVGEDAPYDAIIGLARQGKNLVVFKRNSTHLVTGAGPSSFATRQLAQDIGCIDPRSIVEAAGVVFWLSKHGFMLYDGANITNVSDGVFTTAVAKAVSLRETSDGLFGLTGAVTETSRLDNENVLVTVSQEQFNFVAPNAHITHYTLIFNIPNRTWTTLTFEASGACPSGAFCESTGPVRHSSSPSGNVTHALGYLDDASPYITVNPVKWSTPETTASTSPTLMGSDGSRSIPAEWKSHMVQLASPGYKAAIKRTMLEYTFQVAGDDDEGADGWLVSLIDETGTVLVAEFPVTTQQDPPLEAASRRFRQDTFCEANSVQLRVRYTGASRNITNASILGAWIEYEPAQESHV